MSIFDLCGIDEGELSNEKASLDFSISELNRFIVLYHRKDIDELLTTLASNSEEWKNEQHTVIEESKNVLDGKYTDLFHLESFETIITKERQEGESIFALSTGIDCIASFLKNRIYSFIHMADDTCEEVLRSQQVLHLGITLLNMFVQANFTGPEISTDFPEFNSIYPFKWFSSTSTDALKPLEIDGETPYSLMKYPLLLASAHAVFSVLQAFVQSKVDEPLFSEFSVFSRLWLARSKVIHHRCLLGNPSPTLSKQVHSLYDELETELEPTATGNTTAFWLFIRILIEKGLYYYYTYETEKAKPLFLKAMKYTQLECELTGVQGRRTKYQSFDTSQLLVYAESKMNEDIQTSEYDKMKLNVVQLDEVDQDNILLENILIKPDTEEKLKQQTPLSVMDQILIQCICLDIKNNNPKHGLITEEIGTYVNRIMSHPMNWSVYSFTLLLKTQVEYENMRTKDRAILQLQVLIDQLTNETTPLVNQNHEGSQFNAPIWERLMYIYSLAYPPFWEMKKTLASHYFLNGIVMTALNIYKELELYEDVVNCLEVIGKKDEAIEIIEKKLHEKETPFLMCRLGELKDDPRYYEKSWELSNHHYARAKRDWGDYLYKQMKYTECIPHYKQALDINMLYSNTWFKLAVAYMHTGDFLNSVSCFTSLLKLNPEFGEGWSNLAGVLMKMKKYEEAYEAAQQSIRYLRENWRVWDNYITIAMMCKRYASVLEGLNVLLDIKNKEEMNLDFNLLSNLTYSILNMKVNEKKEEEKKEEGEEVKEEKAVEYDEDVFSALSSELAEIEGHLDEIEEEEEEEEEKTGSKNDKQFLIGQLSKLFERIQKMFPRDTKLYDILYYFYSATNQVDATFDTLLKRTRSTMTGNYLASEESVKKVLKNSIDLLSFVKEKGMEKKEFEVKMLCRSIVSRCQRSFSHLEEFKQLKELMEYHVSYKQTIH